MPKVVETDSWKLSLPKKRREGPLSKISRVHQRAPLRSEDEALVFVEIAQVLQLLQLAGELPLEGFHRYFCKPHRPTAPLRLRFAKDKAPLVAGKRAPDPD